MFLENNTVSRVNDECGLVYICHRNTSIFGSPQTTPVPLHSVSIVASVVHAVAQVELTQIFINREVDPIEAVYIFPVDSNAGLTHFHAELEGRTIKAIVKPQDEAQEHYDKAVQQQQTAFLVESHKSDIFKIRVGFLKPGSQAKIVIQYVTEVKNEKGTHAQRFFIPTTVTPRYIPHQDIDSRTKDLRNMPISTHSPALLSILVNVSIQGHISSITSPTHSINVEDSLPVSSKPNWTRATVKLSGSVTEMNRDFVLLISPKDVHCPRLYIEKFGNSTAMMAHLIPSFTLNNQKVELIFILDRSGSMQGRRIQLVKKAFTIFLHSAPLNCYFNVIGFGSTFEAIFPHPVKYTEQTLSQAVRCVSNWGANLGGTELLAPLKSAFTSIPNPGYLRQIFVLTDGEISNTEEVFGLVKANAHLGRVYSIGIGDGCSHHLIEGLAEAGGGTADFVTNDEVMDSKLLQQLKNAIQPSLSDVSITWDGVPTSAEKAKLIPRIQEKTLLGYGNPIPSEATETPEETSRFKQVPEKIPPICDGSQLVVFGIFPNEPIPTGAKITAESPDGPLSIEMKVSLENDLESTGMIHKLAAIQLIKELEMKMASQKYEQFPPEESNWSGLWLNSRNKSSLFDRTASLKKEIIHISCLHGVSSKYTAFVAVDSEGQNVTKENWVMKTRHVPSQAVNNNNFTPPMQTQAFLFGSPTLTRSSRPRRDLGYSTMPHNSYNSMQPSQNYGCFGFGSPAQSPAAFSSFAASHSPSVGFGFRSASSSTNFQPQASFGFSSTPTQATNGFACFGSTSFSSSAPAMQSFGYAAPSSFAGQQSGSLFSFMPTSTTLTPDGPNKSTPDKMCTLIFIQSFDGSFKLSREFSEAINCDFDILRKEIQRQNLEETAFCTALAVVYFNKEFPDLKDSWELVGKKARDWIKIHFLGDRAALFRASMEFMEFLRK